MSTTASPIADALFGGTRQSVLGLLFAHPDEAFYLRQIVRRTACGVGAIQRELKQLTEAGIVTRRQAGQHVYFQANRQSPIFQELQGLIIKTSGVADVIRLALTPLAPRLRVAFIYGSFARGEQRQESDVDVMIVGDISFAEAVGALRPAQDRISREVNPSIYPPAEFRQKVAAKHHFLTQVLSEPKVFVIGDSHELAAVAG